MASGPWATASVQALIEAIKRSPIIMQLRTRLRPLPNWALIRKSPDVDAVVLAWIAGHVRHRRSRTMM
jgi:hypothetical protein